MDSYPHALASVSEGICPEHLTSLARNDGWCAACRAWWSIKPEDDGLHVVTRYPVRMAGT